ncbi:MAG: hypothetical protein IJZ88_04575 [Clostridia bacterium]|nr:hypothetical protein [Clostridia bacterium]
MKKKTNILMFMLTLFYAVLPVGLVLLNVFEYEAVFNEFALIALLCTYIIVSLVFTVVICRIKSKTKEKVNPVLTALSVIFIIIGWFLLLFQKWVELLSGTLIGVAMLISLICVIVVVVTEVSRKTIAGILLSIMCISLVVISELCLIFGSIGITEVTDTCLSPTGKYRAEVVQVNQGALGGDTVVYAYDCEKELDLKFVKVFKKPELVYLGEYLDCEDMVLEWVSYDTLSINGKEYNIKHPSFA